MKRYVVTAAQACASPHSRFWEGLKFYAKQNQAKLIVLPMIGMSAKEDWDDIHSLFKRHLLYDRRRLNSNITIEQFNIRPYQIDPCTGLSRFAQQGTSLVFASPKQRLVPIAHSHRKYPKFLITTGACTRPNYATSEDVSAERRRLGDIARRDHLYGAVVVEVEDDERYHFRHIRANTDGVFVDLGIQYSDGERKKPALDAMVIGDWHSGQTDPVARGATLRMIGEFKPERLILHDFFDAHSVSHHVEKKPVREKLIQIYDRGFHILDRELKGCFDDLLELNGAMGVGEIVVVYSNHHTFLHRYLEEGRFAKDMQNFRTSVDLLGYMAQKDYNDPVEAGIRRFGTLPKNIKFLKEDEDYKVRGYQLAQHGDHNWAHHGYASVQANEINYGKSIVGHSHRAQILRNSYVVGTCLPRNVFYMRGYPSDWTCTHALLWDTGTVQLVNVIEGEWGAK